MERIFLDTNILLDVFLERHPFCQAAQSIWTLSEKKKIRSAISAVSVNNIFFIVRKLSTPTKAYWAVQTLLETFNVIDVNHSILRRALIARLPDFEDGLQYYSALRFRARAIITRDPSGFSQSQIPIMDSPQYLALHEK